MTQLLFASPNKSNKTDQLVPMVYFRDVNRIHVNRFKAYIQILSNRLNADWHITQDIKQANIVIEAMINKTSHLKSMKMSVLSDLANLKPKRLWTIELAFDENKLVRQLNLASKHLLKGFKGDWHTEETSRTIKVCGLLTESLSVICDLLNQKSKDINFTPCMGVFSSHNDLFRDQMLLIVDPTYPKSMQAYQRLIEKKSQGHTVINELTIAIIQHNDQTVNEEVFDLIYGNADGSTHVTLLNPADESALDGFAKFF